MTRDAVSVVIEDTHTHTHASCCETGKDEGDHDTVAPYVVKKIK